MNEESVPTEATGPFLLPLDLVDESEKLIQQSTAILELLRDARRVISSPEHVLDGVTWALTDQLERLKEICNTRSGEA
jgi:hypothetical protein